MPEDVIDLFSPEKALKILTGNVAPDEEAAPLLVICYGDNDVTMAVLAIETSGMDMQSILRRTLVKLITEHGSPPRWVLFGSEAYAKTYDDPEEAQRNAPGSLSEARQKGDESISEMAVVVGVDASGTGYMAAQFFTRADGEVVFEEPQINYFSESQVEGGIPDILLQAVR